MHVQASVKQIPLDLSDFLNQQSLKQLLLKRKSHHNFKKQPLNFKQISQLLWAAQGILPDGRRTAPSAGALYSFKIFLSVALPPERMNQGLYLFTPETEKLELIFKGNFQKKLFEQALSQKCIIQAPVCIVLTAKLFPVQQTYGNRAITYIFLEGGHIGQNIYLMATALNLGTVAVGAFHDEGVSQILMLSGDEIPVYLFPVGIPLD
ncbi:MAG: SagB/ThcOx family dehydrogenase [Caldisericaceae bacterium]|nr:SagB/ThcOx family dehydrogenase [Caldisericaceae bacterium]